MGRLCVMSSFSPASQGQSEPLKGGTLSQATERCLVVLTFAPARQTQTQVFMGQNGKEIPAFPVSSRQQSHKSQELQKGSSIRRYFRHRGGPAGREPARPDACPLPERAGCGTFSSTTILLLPALFHHMRNPLALSSSDPSKCPLRARSRTWRAHLFPFFPPVGAGEEPDAVPPRIPWEFHFLCPLGAWDTFLAHSWKRPVLTHKK